MYFQPLAKRLLCSIPQKKTESKGGIVLPESAIEVENTALVERVGKAVEEIKEGDYVLYTKYGAITAEVDDKKFFILSEKDVLAVQRKEDHEN